jgi:hypothetical protein
VNTLYCLEEWRGEQRISPPGDNFTPRGQNSPLGSKFAPRGEVKNGPLVFEKSLACGGDDTADRFVVEAVVGTKWKTVSNHLPIAPEAKLS